MLSGVFVSLQFAWDLSLRTIPGYPEVFQTKWQAPEMGVYHYMIGAVIFLHLIRRFAEVLIIHSYSADVKWSTVLSIGGQLCVDVALLDFYLFHTARDLADDEWNIFVLGGAGLWLTGQMGSMKHHWLLWQLRDQTPAAKTITAGKMVQQNAAIAAPLPARPGGGSAKKKAKELSRRVKAAAGATNNGGDGSGATADASGPAAAAQAAAAAVIAKDYLSPAKAGGMFDLVACPHYMYEVCSWLGVAILARHVFSWALALQVRCACYLYTAS